MLLSHVTGMLSDSVRHSYDDDDLEVLGSRSVRLP